MLCRVPESRSPRLLSLLPPALACAAAMTLGACGVDDTAPGEGRAVELEGSRAAEDAVDDDRIDEPSDPVPAGLQVTPMAGLTNVRLLLTLPPQLAGCLPAACAVTIGGEAAEIVTDGPVAAIAPDLWVNVPRFVSEGDVCVAWGDEVDCVSGFTVMSQVIVSAAEVISGHGARFLVLEGQGFAHDVTVTIAGQELQQPGWSSTHHTVQLPEDVPAGVHTVWVRAPSHGRCGATSEPFEVVVP